MGSSTSGICSGICILIFSDDCSVIKCLKAEKSFYDKNFVPGEINEMYSWPYYENSDLLAVVFKEGDNERFLTAAEILFAFPKEIQIHENEKLVSILTSFPKTDKRAEKLIQALFDRNQVKYYKDKKDWSQK